MKKTDTQQPRILWGWDNTKNAETAEHGNCIAHIEQDTDPINPRENFDPFWTIVSTGQGRYDTFGDEHENSLEGAVASLLPAENERRALYQTIWAELRGDILPEDFKIEQEYEEDDCTEEEAEAMLSRTWHDADQIAVLPVWSGGRYGESLSTANEQNESADGAKGYIYATYATLRKEYGQDFKNHAHVLSCAIGGITEMSAFQSGEVYGYTVQERCEECDACLEEDGEECTDLQDVEACWGFYGADYVKEEAERVLITAQQRRNATPTNTEHAD